MKNKLSIFTVVFLWLKCLTVLCQNNKAISVINIVDSIHNTIKIIWIPDSCVYIESKNSHSLLPFLDNNSFKNYYLKNYYYDRSETIGYSIPIKSEKSLSTSELWSIAQNATKNTSLYGKEKYRYGYPTLSLLLYSNKLSDNAAIIIYKEVDDDWIIYDFVSFILPEIDINAKFLSSESIYIQYKKNNVLVEQVGLIDMAGTFNWFYEPSEKDPIVYPFEKK